MIPHATAVILIIALVVLAAPITLAGIIYYRTRIRRAYRENPGLERAMRIREKYRGQG